LALREQISTNRPQGISHIYSQLCLQKGDPLEAEHAMMPCLAEALWQAQKNQTLPDEINYLACLRSLLKT